MDLGEKARSLSIINIITPSCRIFLNHIISLTEENFMVIVAFFVSGGIIYDVIVEPPSVGSTTDEHGHQRPVAFMPYRVNGQYIMEGLASSFMFSLGGAGMIILDQTHNPNTPKLNRIMLQVDKSNVSVQCQSIGLLFIVKPKA